MGVAVLRKASPLMETRMSTASISRPFLLLGDRLPRYQMGPSSSRVASRGPIR